MNYTITFDRPVYSQNDLPVNGLSEICISGRSNVGKSSLINRLANKKNLAKVSQKPGKTRSLNYYCVDKSFYLVDLPGYGYAKVSKSERSLFDNLVSPYLSARSQLVGIIQLLDSRHGPVSGDHVMLDWITQYEGKVLYVFTKLDKISAKRKMELKKTYIKELGAENCVLFSALTCAGIDEIWSWVTDTLGLKREY
ncbi:MAG: YihA family ribosome biogenesis GTP-binding protein [Candidatus Latescibacteria bacterium]|nr:YihA family ribosome biogenesis GTP-binding protein [Candidatus Latescibacterota bacterium]